MLGLNLIRIEIDMNFQTHWVPPSLQVGAHSYFKHCSLFVLLAPPPPKPNVVGYVFCFRAIKESLLV